MEITRENTGELTATIKMVISPSDHQENVTKILKDYQRKANVPGFRPGHVPFGMIKKLYGGAVFAEEVNKLVSDKLHQYISDEKLDILGQPLANTEKTQEHSFTEGQDMEFYFDLGFAPSFDVVLNDTLAIDYHVIKVDETMVDKHLVDLAQRFGELANKEVAEEKDVLFGEFVQLDEEGNVLEDGITHSAKVAIDLISDNDVRSKMIGAKVGDEIVFNPLKATGNEVEASAMLGISKEEVVEIETDFRYHINEISAMVPAEMDAALFEKVFPGVGIETEAEFRNKIRNESEKSFIPDSNHLFTHHLQEKLIETTNISLPDEFMKRWLIESNEGKLTAEDLEKDYSKYADSMKWQLIENKIIINEGINVSDEEIKDTVKDYYWQGWRTLQLSEDLLEKLETMAEKFMHDKPNEIRRLTDSLYMQKIAEVVKSKVTLVEKEISYDEFMKIDAEKH
jgi:trigger factor